MRYIERKICPVYPEGAKKDAYQPVLYGYLLERSPKLVHSVKRPAVIVCPGGAYRYKSEREGDPVAMRFLAAGIHAFVLQYSVAPNRYPAAFLELASAVAEVRKHASEWNVDPEKILVCGFSANRLEEPPACGTSGLRSVSLEAGWDDSLLPGDFHGRIRA